MPFPFFIIAAVICVLLFFVHLVVYKGLVSVFAISSPAALLGLKIFMIVLGAGFVVATILSSQYNNIFTRYFYTITASWYGFLFYIFLAVVLSTVFPSSGRIFIFCAVAVSIYGLWNAERILITRYDVLLPNLPSAWQGRRAVWVSDVHLDQVHEAEYSERIASAIKKEKPDIVFIGGDLYDGVKINERAVIEPFANLRAPKGIYFITGNHEQFGDENRYINAIKEAGIKVLKNEAINIDGLQIIGVDDRDSTQRNVFENVLAGFRINKNEPTILLKHQPFQLDIALKYGVSMQISGHTHRAQVFPLSLITKLIYKGYDYGYKQYGSMQVYTSSGVGTWGPPLRVGTKSEIVVFDF